jgi:hypothetical protein
LGPSQTFLTLSVQFQGFTPKYYEQRRTRLEKPDDKWQWNYKSDEFSPYYIGHIIHYIDGTIMEIRDKEKIENDGK